jgi:zinc protease
LGPRRLIAGVLATLAAVLLGAHSPSAPFASSSSSSELPVRREVLANGLTVLVLEEPGSALVTVAVAYEVGARNEAAGTTGLAHYAEHMTFRGTRRFPGSELADSITRRGGRTSAYTWIDQTYYSSTLAREGLDHLLDLEADRMAEADFDPVEFGKERTSVLAELHSYDDPQSLLYDAVLAVSFEIHPYRNNTIGWLSDVEKVTRDEAYAFYRRFYAPNHAVLVVAGPARPAEVMAKVRERFSSLRPSPESTEVRTIEPLATGQRRITLKQPGTHAQIILAFRAPALRDPDLPTLVLFDALVAGGRGFSGSILRSAGHGAPYPGVPGTLLERATRGRVATVRSDWQVSTYPYVYTLNASVAEAAGLPAAERALFGALQEAAGREWSEEERRRALRQVKAGLAMDMDDQRGRVHQLALFEVAGGNEHLQTLLGRVARVTAADLRRFAQDWLGPDRATVGWFEPVEAAPARAASSPAVREPPEGNATAPAGRARAPSVPPASPRPGPATTTAASPTMIRTSSGLQAFVEERPGARLAAVGGRIEVSTNDEGPAPGLAALATELLARPLPEEGAEAPPFTFRLHDQPTAAANLSAIEFGASLLPDDILQALGVLGRRLARSVPEGMEFERLRAEAVRRAEDADATTAGRLLARALAELFPPGSPGARVPWASAESLERITPADFRRFWKEDLRPDRIRLTVAGDVDAPSVRDVLGRSFARAAPYSPRAIPRPTPRGAPAWKEVRLPAQGASQDDILVVWPGERTRPGDTAATRALLYLFGETGYAGRLGRALVEPGLVYSVEASLEGEGPAAFLAVRTACAPKDAPEVVRRIRAVLEETAQGPFSEAERAEAETYLRGKAARLRDGSVNAAAALLREGLPPHEPPAVSLEDLSDVARRLFARGFPVVLVAGAPVQTNPSETPAQP